jgi:hypothetical protein
MFQVDLFDVGRRRQLIAGGSLPKGAVALPEDGQTDQGRKEKVCECAQGVSFVLCVKRSTATHTSARRSVPPVLHGSAPSLSASIEMKDGSRTDGACIEVRNKVYRKRA